MTISQENAATIMARSARHCCLCRQFLPLQIQIHHIIEKKDGGTDHLGNLISICISCHATVHSTSKMTRNVSAAELRLHRDNVFALVEGGKLPITKASTQVELASITSEILKSLDQNKSKKEKISQRATEILLAAAAENAPIEVQQLDACTLMLRIGFQNFEVSASDSKSHPEELQQLLSDGLATTTSAGIVVTDRGHAYISALVKTTSKYILKKAKCHQCGLHFVIYTWDANRHRSSNITCPECGQKKGQFSIWMQTAFGFIFDQVPGNAASIE